MNDNNPEIEKILDSLAGLCCQALSGQSNELPERSEPLLKTLLMCGFDRQGGPPLQPEIESRMAGVCRDTVMHRGAERTALTGKLQSKFEELARWQSKQPQQTTPPKAANISSATDA